MATTLGALLADGIVTYDAVIATHPFETVKIQASSRTRATSLATTEDPIHGVSVIVRNEGVRAICLGTAYVPPRLTPLLFKDGKTQRLGINMFCGASSCVIGAAAGSPLFLVETSRQSFSLFRPIGT
ncbi:hypothetical protein G7Z17_g9650 [Cylindrodendrum hubeiense]|uniref:Uncharacterized protein n=1 Tax=Cylindrodendrum hubeiense TaxID=595255 RepID=A0A9P5LBZ8_9HYPO|nr:hypothetical protein G7Z17_g9650 [Cylindrodendrum hubeiense]